MNTNNLITRVKNSRFGKIVRRIAGEESGQAMMEYVLIAVLIAAASSVAIWYFGRGIQRQTDVATNAALANPKKAADALKDAQGKTDAAKQISGTSAKTFINAPTENSLD